MSLIQEGHSDGTIDESYRARGQDLTAAIALSPSIVIRPGEQGDAGYIVKSWLREYGRESAYAAAMGTPFYERHHDSIARILEVATVQVACAVEDPETIVGFSVVEAPDARIVPRPATLVHWVHVRREFRGHGIARTLLAPVTSQRGPIVATHVTRKVRVPAGWQIDLYRGLR